MSDKLKILIVDDEPLTLESSKDAVLEASPMSDIKTTTNPQEALDIAGSDDIDIAILDIEMPGMTGLELAKKLKDINGAINVIFLTAYSQYAVEAMRQHASGYILKPAKSEDIKEEFENLRFPIDKKSKKLYVQCFGKFEVFSKGQPLIFKRTAEKEIFAYLVDLKGDGANTEELCGILWPDPEVRERRRDYFRVLINSLKKTLESVGGKDILVKKRNYFAVNTSLIDCDYYDYLRGQTYAVNNYRGEYMSQYDWAEMTVSDLLDG